MKKTRSQTDVQNRIKEAIFALIPEKRYHQITIAAISRVAGINRKTFYNHYMSIEESLLDIEHDYLMEISEQIDRLSPDDFSGALLVYYEFLDADDPVRQKLLYDSEYVHFFEKLNGDVMGLPFFMKFCRNDEYRDFIHVYLCAAAGIYLRWREQPESSRMEIEELAERAAELMCEGMT